MQSNFETLRSEDVEKTLKRVKLTKEAGHHSVYDHLYISMYLENIPRVIEVLLDNERMMTSSVKSGRYTVHSSDGIEKELYEKWVVIFKDKIKEQYAEKSPSFFRPGRIEKLAMENARYLTTCFTLTSMVHTVSYRQFNYLYGFIKDFANNMNSKNSFNKRLKPYLEQFLVSLEETGFIDELLINNGKERVLSLFNTNKPVEYFGDVYVTNYKATFAYFTHANRHRTLKHYIDFIKEPNDLEFYIPEIIRGTELEMEWLADMDKVRDNFPQALMVDIVEMGNLDDFILKVYERKCAVVLLETNRVTNMLLSKYYDGLKETKHPRESDLKPFMKGARCTFPKFVCSHPCQFGEAVNEKRKI